MHSVIDVAQEAKLVICSMTSITDALHNARAMFGMGGTKSPEEVCRTISRPLPSKQHRRDLVTPLEASALEERQNTDAYRSAACTRARWGPLWGLLLPITSDAHTRTTGGLDMLQRCVDALVHTTTASERLAIFVFVGIDQQDPAYNEDNVRRLFGGCGFAGVDVTMLHAGFSGNLCPIWNLLAKKAVLDFDVDYLMLLGDDVLLETPGWKGEVEADMLDISTKAGLPNGMACVAFQDRTMPVFPSFPVIHRHHVEKLGAVLPDDFIDQGGDAFLFEIYRRWGAAAFAKSASLRSNVGEERKARYRKSNLDWQDSVLTKGLQRFSDRVRPTGPRHRCLGVVVPTYRCDPAMLTKIVSLKPIIYPNISVQVIVVVDNPDAENLEDVKALASIAKDHTIRILVNDENVGASESRNIGLSQSFSDHVVLLDDDIKPDRNILDAYLGAFDRYPEGHVFLGCTCFPPAQTTVQQAFEASRWLHFFDIAEKVPHPPWGVSANICVRGRMRGLRFSLAYPKTGGGEDLDYCIRIRQRHGAEAIVSVPGARVTHPYWKRPIRQIWGWAQGDVRCLRFLPYSTFYRPPDWAEIVVLVWVIGPAFAVGIWWCLWISFVVASVEYGKAVIDAYSGKSGDTPWIAVLLAPVPRVVQDIAFLAAKLRGLHLYQLLLSFDFMDGSDEHEWRQTQRASFALKIAVDVCIVLCAALGYGVHGALLGLLMLVIYVHWWTHRAVGKVSKRSGPSQFIVLAWQRTGSDFLCELLHGHSDVFMHNEMFHDRAIHTYHKEQLEEWKWTVKRRDADRKAFITDVFSQCETPGQSIGFKLLPEHINQDPETMAWLLSDPSVKKIVLSHRNPVVAYVSQRRALKTGEFLQMEKPREISVHVDPVELQRHLVSYEQCYATYDQLLEGQGCLHVAYEDLCDDKMMKTSFLKVADFLGIGMHVPASPPIRQRSAFIGNHAEVMRAFRHTAYSDSVDECAPPSAS